MTRKNAPIDKETAEALAWLLGGGGTRDSGSLPKGQDRADGLGAKQGRAARKGIAQEEPKS